ncbi:hypothetical protein NDU88_004291 [Pleurodeles waltl]|uniref:NADH dehydrogenase [ubiquinone] 1 alpha subcomplex assembly factor 4 n=1 Tax=Pleurodeles waltl TaxID=8319 RepID=A0AAV7RIW9_PLEWA|nr:hypothetical protein NDU88_004291 [Pleurodeles waltl]
MGGLVARAFRNFNVESRAHKVLSQEKPKVAPLHPTTPEELRVQNTAVRDKIYKKDDHLLSLLREVYVDSTDPTPVQAGKRDVINNHQEGRRLPKQTFKHDYFSILDVENIPKGKLSIIEALTVLSNHKRQPETWTAEKIAEEYNLELKDTKSLLEFFIPFDVKIIPPTDAKQIKPT